MQRSKNYIVFVRLPLLFVCFSICLITVFSKRGILDWRRMVHENNSLSRQLKEGYLERERIQRRVEALETSHQEQERVVRQMLGYVRPNETVIEFP